MTIPYQDHHRYTAWTPDYKGQAYTPDAQSQEVKQDFHILEKEREVERIKGLVIAGDQSVNSTDLQKAVNDLLKAQEAKANFKPAAPTPEPIDFGNLFGQDFACTMQYDPVCGSDGVTYSNACEAQRGAFGFSRTYTPGACAPKFRNPRIPGPTPEELRLRQLQKERTLISYRGREAKSRLKTQAKDRLERLTLLAVGAAIAYFFLRK